MEAIVCMALLGGALAAWVRAGKALERTASLERRLERLAAELGRRGATAIPTNSTQSESAPPVPSEEPREVSLSRPGATVPPPLPTPAIAPPRPKAASEESVVSTPIREPRAQGSAATGAAKPAAASARGAGLIDWEQFMGVKLLAWLGGLAFFLGMAYGVRYSFEHGWISPALRVTLGFVTGTGLVAGGVAMRRKAYEVMSQTLCATGAVTLYAVTFACHAVYHFPAFGTGVTFLAMALITGVAFLLAVRMEAKVIALLGMLGGFLTPLILSTGQDNPVGLFGYIALLDVGLLAVALHRRWHFLAGLGAAGTAFLQLAWFIDRLTAAKLPMALGIVVLFELLFIGAVALARKRQPSGSWMAAAAAGLAGVSGVLCVDILGHGWLATQPWMFFAFVLAGDLTLMGVAALEGSFWIAPFLGAGASFLLLGAWTFGSISPGVLLPVLGIYLAYGVIHSAFPLWMQRRRPGALPPSLVAALPLPTLVLMLLPLIWLDGVSWVLWPAVILVDLLVLGVAVATLSLGGVVVSMVLTFLAAGIWLMRWPMEAGGGGALVTMLGTFAVFFAGMGVFLRRWLQRRAVAQGDRGGVAGSLKAEAVAMGIPVYAGVMPFLLLILATGVVPLPQPGLVFGLAALLSLMLLGFARLLSQGVIPLVAAGCVVALEIAWQGTNLRRGIEPLGILAWYGGFGALFALFPFLFRRTFDRSNIAWAGSALVWVMQFFPVYWLARTFWPDAALGVIPTVFALPPLVALEIRRRQAAADHPGRLAQLAWFGGVGLFFVTLIFPVQFDREWLTVGWALEGVALVALFHRIPHPGLRTVAMGLLSASFVRLALNPEVLSYHARSATPVFNWYLYTYGTVAVSLFAAAALYRRRGQGAATPEECRRVAFLNTLGAILGFVLLNLEVADYFTPAGQAVLTFDFSGQLARDMAYSIGWALYALGLLAVGISRRARGARMAGVALLGVTLMKLFLHDLARLDSLYRIGALIGVATIAMGSSFLYQRFLADQGESGAPTSGPRE